MTGGGPDDGTGGTGSGEGAEALYVEGSGDCRGTAGFAGFWDCADDALPPGPAPDDPWLSDGEEHPAVTASTPARIEADQRNDLEKSNCMRCLLRRTRRNRVPREAFPTADYRSVERGGRRGVAWSSWKASLQDGIRCRECQLGIWPDCPENTGFVRPLAGTNDAFAKVAPAW